MRLMLQERMLLPEKQLTEHSRKRDQIRKILMIRIPRRPIKKLRRLRRKLIKKLKRPKRKPRKKLKKRLNRRLNRRLSY